MSFMLCYVKRFEIIMFGMGHLTSLTMISGLVNIFQEREDNTSYHLNCNKFVVSGYRGIHSQKGQCCGEEDVVSRKREKCVSLRDILGTSKVEDDFLKKQTSTDYDGS
jgi:hypothetical protein